MTNQKEGVGLKKYERFKLKSGAIAIIRALSGKQDRIRDISFDESSLHTKLQYCQIISIDEDGLLLRYIDKNGGSKEPVELDLLFIQDSICFTYLKKVPIKTVGVSQVGGKNSFSHVKTIQRDVRFGEMTLHQKSQLARFIKKYTII